MPKSNKPPDTKKAVIYVEVPLALKERMEGLAKDHERKLTGEVIVALREYVARHEEGGER
jgi:hypothetical protein